MGIDCSALSSRYFGKSGHLRSYTNFLKQVFEKYWLATAEKSLEMCGDFQILYSLHLCGDKDQLQMNIYFYEYKHPWDISIFSQN